MPGTGRPTGQSGPKQDNQKEQVVPIYIETVPRHPDQPEPVPGETPPILIETVPKAGEDAGDL
jgi:hypothetical protein